MKITKENLSKIIGITEMQLPWLVKCAKDREWRTFFSCVQEAFRFEVFAAVQENLNDYEYWVCFRGIWQGVENLWEDHELIKCLLQLRPNPERMMDADDKAALGKLPARLNIYRGGMTVDKPRLSWSLSKKVAEKFATNFQSCSQEPRCCWYGKCQKDDVIAVLLGRQEEEVLIVPENVSILKQVPMKAIETYGRAFLHTKKETLKIQELIRKAQAEHAAKLALAA